MCRPWGRSSAWGGTAESDRRRPPVSPSSFEASPVPRLCNRGPGNRRSAAPRGPAPVERGSEGHRLGATLDLSATVLPQRVDRPARQRVVGREQPGEDEPVVVPAVVQHGADTGHALGDLAVLDQRRVDLLARSGAGYGSCELVLPDQLPDLAGSDAQQLTGLSPVEPVVDQVVESRAFGDVRLLHPSTVPRRPSAGTATRTLTTYAT